MAVVSIMDILKSKKVTPEEFEFDNYTIPPMYYFLTQEDVDQLRAIATSARLSSKIREKYSMIDDIMARRGFKRFSAGTNRVVYRFLESDDFLVKIAVDKVGMQDNPMEFRNQQFLKPFVSKTFYTSPCGTVGFVERVLPIKNKEEFKEVAPEIFDIIINKIIGKYVVEDIGTKYFMNWGIRKNYYPVLLDYPYVYELDGNKLFCSSEVNGEICNGEIDYDAGFNYLVCTKCGRKYMARDLKDNSINNKLIIRKGEKTMDVIVRKGGKIIARSISSDSVIRRSSTDQEDIAPKDNDDHKAVKVKPEKKELKDISSEEKVEKVVVKEVSDSIVLDDSSTVSTDNLKEYSGDEIKSAEKAEETKIPEDIQESSTSDEYYEDEKPVKVKTKAKEKRNNTRQKRDSTGRFISDDDDYDEDYERRKKKKNNRIPKID